MASLKMRNCPRELFNGRRSLRHIARRLKCDGAGPGRARWVQFGRSSDPSAPRPRPISFQFYQLHRAHDARLCGRDLIWRAIAGRRKHNKWRGRRRPAPDLL